MLNVLLFLLFATAIAQPINNDSRNLNHTVQNPSADNSTTDPNAFTESTTSKVTTEAVTTSNSKPVQNDVVSNGVPNNNKTTIQDSTEITSKDFFEFFSTDKYFNFHLTDYHVSLAVIAIIAVLIVVWFTALYFFAKRGHTYSIVEAEENNGRV